MCCFVVPLVQALATSAYRKINSKSIETSPAMKHYVPDLEKMLWGGSVMLIVDHIVNGELTWMFPFFTALGEAGGTQVFWHEILTVGVPMSLVITAVWVLYAAVKLHRSVAVAK